MIASRTKEALARKKSEGARLGRPKGKLFSVIKLSGKDDLIREYLQRNIHPNSDGKASQRQPIDFEKLHNYEKIDSLLIEHLSYRVIPIKANA